MLGAEAAAELAHEIVHRLLEHGLAGEECAGVGAGPLADVEMQVAIPQVPIGDDFAVGDQGLREQGAALDQCGQRCERYRYIVLEALAVAGLRRRDPFAQLPHCAALRDGGRDHRIDDDPLSGRAFELRRQ